MNFEFGPRRQQGSRAGGEKLKTQHSKLPGWWELQLVRDGCHGVADKLDVLAEVDPELFRTIAHIIAIDASGEGFVFELLFDVFYNCQIEHYI